MSRPGEQYVDHPVRHYVLTDGRAIPSRNTIRPETLLIADSTVPARVSASRQQRWILELCDGMLSVAEIAAHLALPVSLVAVLISDLIDSGHLRIRTHTPDVSMPDRDVLEKVLDGLRSL